MNDDLMRVMQLVMRATPQGVIWGPEDPAPKDPLPAWRASHRHMTGLHHHPHPEVCIALDNASVMELGPARFVLKPGQIVVLRPEQPHCESCLLRNKGYRVMWLVSVGEGALAVVLEYEPGEGWVVAARTWLRTGTAQTLHTALTDSGLVESPTRFERLRAHLMATLAEMHRDRMEAGVDPRGKPTPGTEMRQGDHLALHVRGLIEQRLDHRLSMRELSRLMHVSPSYLHRVFRRCIGESVNGYATRLRLDEAMRLLRTTDLLVKQVAARVGFEDPLHFSRQFRRHYGRSPEAARRHGTL